MQRFHGTAARQLVLIENVQPSTRLSASLRPAFGSALCLAQAKGVSRIRLMQKDMYAELTRRRRRAQIAARRWTEGRSGSREVGK
jgi:hypothetical protein